MNVGVVGLGLIGGSFAKAYKNSGNNVFAYDIERSVLDFAMISGVVDGELNADTIADCDLIVISVMPNDAIEYFENNAQYMSKSSLVIDCCGTKRTVCKRCFEIADKYGLTFVGGHPMAGTHRSGFKNSDGAIFAGAPMVIVPPKFDEPALLQKVEELLKPAGFGKFSVTTAENHDRIIAYTSQLAHVVSNAYVKSPTAEKHFGFSAGSYKDLTRVAWLNPNMWSELFMENSDFLISEIDEIIDELSKYKNAISTGNKELLTSLLEEGRSCKERIDG